MNDTPDHNTVRGVGTATDPSMQGANSFVSTHGRSAVTILAGGAIAALGTFLPFIQVVAYGNYASINIMQIGIYGFLLFAIAVLLGILPVWLKQFMHLRLAAYGVSCAIFGLFFFMWLGLSGLATLIGSALGGLGMGFYMELLGFGAMVVGYYLLQKPLNDSSRQIA